MRAGGAHDQEAHDSANLRGVFLCTKYTLPSMLERGRGCIINISSGAGVVGPPNRSAYAASKHGVMGLTKSLVAEYLQHGIRTEPTGGGPFGGSSAKDWCGRSSLRQNSIP